MELKFCGKHGKIYQKLFKEPKTGVEQLIALKVVENSESSQREIEIAKRFGNGQHPNFLPILYTEYVDQDGQTLAIPVEKKKTKRRRITSHHPKKGSGISSSITFPSPSSSSPSPSSSYSSPSSYPASFSSSPYFSSSPPSSSSSYTTTNSSSSSSYTTSSSSSSYTTSSSPSSYTTSSSSSSPSYLLAMMQKPTVAPQPSYIAFAMPYIPCTLLKYLEEHKMVFSEGPELRSIFFQILSAVSHMHKHGYVHKDLKLENLLLDTAAFPHHVYLCDFGFSRPFVKGERQLFDNIGSEHYAAPELWEKMPYEGPEVDLWALGVCLYALCTGEFPFGGNSNLEIFQAIQRSQYNGIEFPRDLQLSPALRDLISRLLSYSPDLRLSTSEILSHPWSLNKERSNSLSLPPPISTSTSTSTSISTSTSTTSSSPIPIPIPISKHKKTKKKTSSCIFF